VDLNNFSNLMEVSVAMAGDACAICTFPMGESGMYDDDDDDDEDSQGAATSKRFCHQLNCGHSFHTTCLKELVKSQKSFIQVSRQL
jgi:hypothetical protein